MPLVWAVQENAQALVVELYITFSPVANGRGGLKNPLFSFVTISPLNSLLYTSRITPRRITFAIHQL